MKPSTSSKELVNLRAECERLWRDTQIAYAEIDRLKAELDVLKNPKEEAQNRERLPPSRWSRVKLKEK